MVWRECQTRRQTTFDHARRTKAIREMKLQKLQHIAKFKGLENFEAVERDRFPKSHHTFQTFINQSASTDVSKSEERLVDWNLPIKLRLIFLPDQIM